MVIFYHDPKNLTEQTALSFQVLTKTPGAALAFFSHVANPPNRGKELMLLKCPESDHWSPLPLLPPVKGVIPLKRLLFKGNLS